MKKILSLAAVLMLMGAGCSFSQQTTVQTQPPAQPAAEPTIPPAPPAPPAANANLNVNANVNAGSVAVTIQGFAFSPSSITAKKGDKVVFTNQDPMGHTVTADGGAFSSGTIASGESFTLDTSTLAAGSYAFHCSIHPTMQATLIVQ